MTKNIDRLELAICSDIFFAVASLILNSPITTLGQKLIEGSLRAADCKYREFEEKGEKSDFLIFFQEKLFGELVSMIALKLPEEF